jgi:hypothetical protein
MSEKSLQILKDLENKAFALREAADKIWEMAKEYQRMGLHDVSLILKDLSSQLHDMARKEEEKIDN